VATPCEMLRRVPELVGAGTTWGPALPEGVSEVGSPGIAGPIPKGFRELREGAASVGAEEVGRRLGVAVEIIGTGVAIDEDGPEVRWTSCGGGGGAGRGIGGRKEREGACRGRRLGWRSGMAMSEAANRAWMVKETMAGRRLFVRRSGVDSMSDSSNMMAPRCVASIGASRRGMRLLG